MSAKSYPRGNWPRRWSSAYGAVQGRCSVKTPNGKKLYFTIWKSPTKVLLSRTGQKGYSVASWSFEDELTCRCVLMTLAKNGTLPKPSSRFIGYPPISP